MPNKHAVATRAGICVLAITLSACAHSGARPEGGATLADGQAVMDRCTASELLVVQNQTGYPVRVRSTDGSAFSSSTSAQHIQTVSSGTVDSIPGLAMQHAKVQFDVEQPAFTNGQQPMIHGLQARCVPKV
jgi:hypothetical protein